MKNFIIGSIITMIILIVLVGYRQNFFSTKTYPYDDEQVGLENQVIIKFSHVVAENTPKGMAAEKFADLVNEKSNGRIIVQVYPNGMLYSDDKELQALKEGEIQMIAPSFSKMTDYLPNWQVLDLPFLVEDEEQLEKVLTGNLSKQLLSELDSLNIKGLTFWSNGFKQIATSGTPIIELQDFWHKKVRMMSSDILKEQYLLLRAKPVDTTFDTLYNDLENHLIEAQENTISNLYSKKFYQIENQITLSNHGILCYAVMFNEEFWNNLNSETQSIIIESLNEMQEWQFNQAKLINEKNLVSLSNEENVQIYELDEINKTKWKKKLSPIYDYYRKNVNAQYLDELLEEINN
ncbi:C4-dicarboxylate ABC transporter [Ureibacillus massiliensis 4400831 = CIP 108448 = CCUG 49529]|uniref:C4-dicarboxylate ABC transporter n=1 Tax=Ureibacillus massiliensis 4400831 = CIP 108448 = CCUG 49529 TaxID=1211035 RepID=A0A0A3IS67_9BACL|nr:DctP family TRAP transporter solute-binding subunit [Ureibacillus massiliensis]KGR87624.1 C4-dicarboxylate ABC transporter [Ureibacillus massiliensis 4400831 = CIP 108448 = CCUG 49529]